MAIVCYFRRPDYFITFTANLQWPEIVDNLFPRQQPINQPDLIVRVFQLKIQKFLADLKNSVLGLYAGYVNTIKYQKQGLLYIHLLLFFLASARICTPK
jgi:hypothetical protein